MVARGRKRQPKVPWQAKGQTRYHSDPSVIEQIRRQFNIIANDLPLRADAAQQLAAFGEGIKRTGGRVDTQPGAFTQTFDQQAATLGVLAGAAGDEVLRAVQRGAGRLLRNGARA